MSHYGRYGDMDYAAMAKRTFLLGAGLVLAGFAGEYLVHSMLTSLADWGTVFLSMEAVGILVGLLGPILYGAVLPLTE